VQSKVRNSDNTGRDRWADIRASGCTTLAKFCSDFDSTLYGAILRGVIDNTSKQLLVRFQGVCLGRFLLFLSTGFLPNAYADIGDVYNCVDLKSYSSSDKGRRAFERLWFTFQWREGHIEVKEASLSKTTDIVKIGVEIFRSMEPYSGSGAQVIMFNDGAYSEFTIFIDGTYFYRAAKCDKFQT
jgi:hypothetical protein